ncbi:MAG TPA: DUF72 domain-containing protein [Cyclobacteriaceae bacterium]|nr:DUF72 domain-containing protein [Cyclobacteriaceae bacterium]
MKGNVFIGTSGWHYKHWRGNFYPEGTKADEQLAFYIKQFPTVEINNSFYRVPPATTFDGWGKAVPNNFVFAVKANRYFTHLKKLKVDKEEINHFLEKVERLGGKAGPILFQLPPNWKINLQRLEEFLSKLPKHHRYTVEFRNPTWCRQELFDLLHQFNAAFCIYDLAGHQSPRMVTADFIYVRLHGPGDKYQGRYSPGQLENWAQQCRQWLQQGRDVFIYFDNDEKGYAAINAMELSAILDH